AEVPGKGTRQLMVYRSYWGIHAVDIKSGSLMWDADCPWSLEKMYTEPRTQQAIDTWKQQGYNPIGRLNIAFENSVIGGLATDGQRVYARADLPVPPLVQHVNQRGQPMQVAGSPRAN